MNFIFLEDTAQKNLSAVKITSSLHNHASILRILAILHTSSPLFSRKWKINMEKIQLLNFDTKRKRRN